MLGFVRTARIKASSPSDKSVHELKKIRVDYYRYVVPVENVPTIVVMQDLDDRPGTGSFWGEVNSAVHQGLKVSGVLTNGSVRDLGDLSRTFPILAGSIGPSHAHVHVVDFGCPVAVLGIAVVHDTLIHADQHGAVIIPLEYLKELPECIDRIQRKEAFLLAAARSGSFDIAALEQAMLTSEDIH
jgi:regulator of RNase E activity RraA